MAKNTGKEKVAACELAYPGKETEGSVLASVDGAPELEPVKAFGTRRAAGNLLIYGDNLDGLKSLIMEKRAGRLKNPDGSDGARLVYIDPPFSTRLEFKGKKDQKAYNDNLVGAEFVEFLRKRIILLKELLADDGSIFVHLDWKMAHHMKVVMDEIFGPENFLNDIIWSYGGRGAKAIAGQFSRNHDIILWYKKKAHIFNQLFVERRIRKGEAGFRKDEHGRWFKTSPRGDYTDKSIAGLREAGRVHETSNGKIRIKYFLREDGDYIIEDKLVGDVWDDIPDAMHLNGGEKTGYPTQKPEALLRRIVSAASNEGDIVLDAFAGSGTTLAVAEKLGRKWIGIDSGKLSVHTMEKRLLTLKGTPDAKDPKKKYLKKCTPFTLMVAGDPGCAVAHGQALSVKSRYSVDEQTGECIIKIERVSSPEAKAAGIKGLDSLSCVMLDLGFNGKTFHLDTVYYAAELKELGYAVRFPQDKLRGEVLIIYADIYGNENWFAGNVS